MTVLLWYNKLTILGHIIATLKLMLPIQGHVMLSSTNAILLNTANRCSAKENQISKAGYQADIQISRYHELKSRVMASLQNETKINENT